MRDQLDQAMRELDIMANLPQNLEAEVAVLAGVMMDRMGDAMEAAQSLTPEHFSSVSHSTIWKTILEFHSKGLPIDAIALCSSLKSKNQLNEVGGDHFIFTLQNKYPTSAHTAFYVGLIKEKYRLRRTVFLCEEFQKQAFTSEDSHELLSRIESQFFDINSESNSKDINLLDQASETLQWQIDSRLEGKKLIGLQTGIPSFDSITGGLMKSQYYVLGGRASAGKSAFADQISMNMIQRNIPFLYIALEGSEERVLGKISCKMADVCYSDFIKGYCSKEELNKIKEKKDVVKASRMVIKRPTDITGSEIRSMIRREKRVNQIELVILDYLQKVTIPDKWDERRAISNASDQIQKACVESSIPALILVQLNREAEKEARPRMRHLKESGQIEQDADFIGLLFYETDKYDVPYGEDYPVIMSVEKNRDGMSGIDQKFMFNGKLMKFKEEIKNKEWKNYADTK